ncbi:MAG: CBASS cGAMP synthase [Alphaproteobacteria bacterium]|nr:CBASS cGAMP synthase [Alphaproteobacteria bacterium]
MTIANANVLFRGLKQPKSFNQQIHIQGGDPEDKLLRRARAKIRRRLRDEFSAMPALLKNPEIRSALFENRDSEFKEAAHSQAGLNIRFLTQGSFAYGTLIRPAQPNCQEIDLDDGVYFPMRFVNGRPLYSSEGLFLIVERALGPLLEAEGWTLSLNRKATCVRVILLGANAHIDLPLFAVEETDFSEVLKRFENRTGQTFTEAKNINSILAKNARDVRLLAPSILLAHREEDWVVSDPKTIEDWFNDSLERYGPVLRRLCRYAKAWRDETWSNCELSSIALMAVCVDELAKANQRPADDRDDLLLLEVAKALPIRIRQGHIVWRNGEPPLDAKWTPEQREAYAFAAEAFYDNLFRALNRNYDRDRVVAILREALGNRFPNAPEAVKVAAAAQTAAVLDTKASKVAMPVVGNSVSA